MYLIRAETAVRYEDRTPFTPPTSDRTPITAIPRSRFAIALPHPQKAIHSHIPKQRFLGRASSLRDALAFAIASPTSPTSDY
jgi:hypothetical protein